MISIYEIYESSEIEKYLNQCINIGLKEPFLTEKLSVIMNFAPMPKVILSLLKLKESKII